MSRDHLTKPLASYSHSRRLGNTLYLAGQGCRDPRTNQEAGVSLDESGRVLSYDIAAQTRGVFANIERALTAAGLDKHALVDVQVFLTDMEDFASMNRVWNEYFSGVEVPPTRTTVAVKALPGHNFVEMKAIAALAGDPHHD